MIASNQSPEYEPAQRSFVLQCILPFQFSLSYLYCLSWIYTSLAFKLLFILVHESIRVLKNLN